MKTLAQIESEIKTVEGEMAPLVSQKGVLEGQRHEAIQREHPNADWKPSGDAPDGMKVLTKIDDANGVRNVCILKRSGNLWFVPDGSMYVYYRPTHFAFIS